MVDRGGRTDEAAFEPWLRGKRLAWDDGADERALDAFDRAQRAAEDAGTTEAFELGVDAGISRAWVLSRLGRDDEAWDAAREADRFARAAYTPAAWERLAWGWAYQSLCHRVRGDGDPDAVVDASRLAADAVELAGTEPGERYARQAALDAARVLDERNRTGEAIEQYERAVSLTTGSELHVVDHLALGDARAETGDLIGAVDAWEAVLEASGKPYRSPEPVGIPLAIHEAAVCAGLRLVRAGEESAVDQDMEAARAELEAHLGAFVDLGAFEDYGRLRERVRRRMGVNLDEWLPDDQPAPEIPDGSASRVDDERVEPLRALWERGARLADAWEVDPAAQVLDRAVRLAGDVETLAAFELGAEAALLLSRALEREDRYGWEARMAANADAARLGEAAGTARGWTAAAEGWRRDASRWFDPLDDDDAVEAYRAAIAAGLRADTRAGRRIARESAHELGVRLCELGRLDEAVESLQRAIGLWEADVGDSPRDRDRRVLADYRGALAHAFDELDRYEATLEEWENIEDLLGDDPDTVDAERLVVAELELARLTESRGDRTRAAAHRARALALIDGIASRGTRYDHLRRHVATELGVDIDELRRAGRRETLELRELRDRVTALQREGSLEAADEALARLIESARDVGTVEAIETAVESARSLAADFERVDRFDDAERITGVAVELLELVVTLRTYRGDPRDEVADDYVELGRTRYDLGDETGAEAALNEALKHALSADPEGGGGEVAVSAWVALARILRDREDIDAAVHAYRRAVEVGRGTATWYGRFTAGAAASALANYLLSLERPAHAVDAIERAIDLGERIDTHPNNLADDHLTLGTALAETGAFDEAIEAFDRVLDLVGDDPPWGARTTAAQLSRGRAYEALGERTTAIEAYRAVFDLDEPYPPPSTWYVDAVEAGLHLARLADERGDIEEAERIRDRTWRLYRAEEESLAWVPGDSLRLRFPPELREALDELLGE